MRIYCEMIIFWILVLCVVNVFGDVQINENEIPELKYLDKTVNPCENFYKFTCGNFDKVHPKPDDQPIWDQFTILQKEIHEVSLGILQSERNENEAKALQKAKAFYSACMNLGYMEYLNSYQTHLIDNLGLWPAVSQDQPEHRLTWNEIADIIADYGVPFFFEFTVTSSLFNGTGNVIYISQDTLTNPDAGIIGLMPEDFNYLNPIKKSRSEKNEPIPYEIFLSKAGYRMRDISHTLKTNAEIDTEMADVLTYLRYIDQGGIFDGDDDITIPAEMTIKELQEWTDGYFGPNSNMNWLQFFKRVFRYSGVVITEDMKTMQTSGKLIYGILNLYEMSTPAMVSNYIYARLITNMAPDGDEYMREIYKDFYNAHGYTVYERDEYCLRKTVGYPYRIDFSMAVTYEYQKYHFNINKLETAAQMVVDLQDSFKDILNETDWMDDISKQKALKKADYMITLLGYPDYAEKATLLDDFYKNLKVCTWDHFGNSQMIRAFKRALNYKEIGNPKNRELWSSSPLEVNAFYNRATNRILLPVSMLNPVFFNEEVKLLNYARIGAVIGHEITHGFDKAGKSYNIEGVQGDFWPAETTQAFDERAKCFENQYSNYYIEEIDKYLNGTTTLNENLADNGGLHAAYAAYHKLKKRINLPLSSQYSSEQLFFIGFGTMWCMTETETYLNNMHGGQYSPGRFRVNGVVSNMEEFAEAFNCPVGSPMNPENKCLLWS